MKPLYVAATGQHVGKTTSTLGLVTNIVEHGYDVGYCKPVGQQHLYVEGQMIDKDVTLFSQILNFKIDALFVEIFKNEISPTTHLCLNFCIVSLQQYDLEK